MKGFKKNCGTLSLLLICMLYLYLLNAVDLFAKTYCNISEVGEPQRERPKLFHGPVLPQIKFIQALFIAYILLHSGSYMYEHLEEAWQKVFFFKLCF